MEKITRGRPTDKLKLDKHIKEIIKMLKEGWVYDDIADHFNVTTMTVFNFIKRRNLKGFKNENNV
jgi:hypothetical protein